MKSSFLAALGAAGLLLAGCSEEKRMETATAMPDPLAAPPVPADTAAQLITTSATPIPISDRFGADTAVFRTDARHLASRVAGDLKLTDKTTTQRLEGVYYTRRRHLARLNDRYRADTTGRYAAVRGLNDETDRQVRRLLPNPVQVRTYESSRAGYYDGPFTATAADAEVEAAAAEVVPAVASAAKTTARPRRRGARIIKYKKRGGEVKIKYSDGTVVKIDKDGDRTIRHGIGHKVKVAANNGKRKGKK